MLPIFEILLQNVNYLTVFILMTIESSFVPFPSELIMLPAGYLISTNTLKFAPILFLSTLGSVVGALINYFIGKYLGRKYLLKHKKFFFITEKHLDMTESFFKKRGSVTTFTGRLIPVVRQYISIPAGFSNMNLFKFILYTALGAGIWMFFLICLGYNFGIAVSQGIARWTNYIILFVVGIIIVYIICKFVKLRKSSE